MIVGYPGEGSNIAQASANQVRSFTATLGRPFVPHDVILWVDGNGAGGDAILRPVVHGPDLKLAAVGPDVTVLAGEAGAWRNFPLEPVLLPAGDYTFGIHWGGVTNAARRRTQAPPPGSMFGLAWADTFTDGTTDRSSTPTSNATVSMYANVSLQAQESPFQTRELAADRAFPKAQALLAGTPSRNLGIVEVGWYDSDLDLRQGSVALVREGGPYEDLIGDVLRLTREDRDVIYVYVVGARQLEEDVALARRPYLALAPLWTETLDVLAEVVE